MKLIVVEDDAGISSFITKGFAQAGFVVDAVGTAEEALALFRQNAYETAVVDLTLPGKDGFWLIETIRREGIPTPVLILSARHGIDDKIRGLQKGGDDYMTKPYAFSELLARIQAMVRRASMSNESKPLVLEIGDLRIDLLKREVRRGGTAVELQPKEYSLLELLARNAGNVISKTMILERVWDYHFDPQTNVVDVLVSRLRNKIDKSFDPPMIHTVRGVGYVLKISED